MAEDIGQLSLFVVIFRNGAETVGVQQIHKIVHPGLEHLALIGVGHLQAHLHPLDDIGLVVDVCVGLEGVLLSCEGLVFGSDAAASVAAWELAFSLVNM